MNGRPREISTAWLSTVAGLLCTALGALGGFATASYQAGKQLAVLDDIKPALLQIQAHETRLAVFEESCCTERPKRTSAVEAASQAWCGATPNPSSARLHWACIALSERHPPASATSSAPLPEAVVRPSELAVR